MEYSRVLLVYLILYCVVGCNYNSEKDNCEKNHSELNYSIKNQLVIDVNGVQYQHNATQILVTDSALLYYALDVDRRIIDVFSLSNLSLVNSINLSSDGPNAIIGVSYMNVISQDSIYLMATYTNSLYLINARAEVIKRWQFDTIALPDSLMRSPNSAGSYSLLGLGMPEFFNAPFWISKDGTELRAVINYDNTYEDNRDYSYQYMHPPIVHFNLIKNVFENFDGEFPPMYFKEKRPHNALHRFLVVNSSDVLSFTSSDKLFFAEKNAFICARSKYDTRKITLFQEGEEQDEEAEINSYITEGSYSGLIHDPYRKRIYRIYAHPQEKLNLDGLLNRKNETAWSILVLDYAGKVLGEAVFEPKKYDYFNINVLPEGLLISKENTSNPANTEDLLEFDIIEIIE